MKIESNVPRAGINLTLEIPDEVLERIGIADVESLKYVKRELETLTTKFAYLMGGALYIGSQLPTHFTNINNALRFAAEENLELVQAVLKE